MRRRLWGCWLAGWLLLAGGARAGAGLASQADLGFAGPALSGAVSLAPADPSAPFVPAPTPEPDPETPTCPSGQRWDSTTARCTNPCTRFGRHLSWSSDLNACYQRDYQETESEFRDCRTADNRLGTQKRVRSRWIYQLRYLDGSRGTFAGAWSTWPFWGGCVVATDPAPEPDDRPSLGSVFIIKALICGPADTGYDSAPGAAWAKSQVIDYYRSFGASRRCPEAGGFQHWLQNWHDKAVAWVQRYGMWHDYALEQTWPEIRYYMDLAAVTHRELDPPDGDSGIPAADALCHDAARARWSGFSGAVRYQVGSGNLCTVTSL